ncbi:MAG: hypothetical protein ACM3X7_09555 [Solirubrobacterales bacterium]
MSGLFKKALFGYNTSEVDMKIKLSRIDFDKTKVELEDSIAAAMSENNRLIEEHKRLLEEKSLFDEYNKEIEIILRHCYEKASIEVYNTKKTIEKELCSKREELENLENKNQDINNSINKLLDKLHGITNQQ